MGTGYILFKGNDIDIEMIEKLFIKLNSIYNELGNGSTIATLKEEHLREYLNKNPEENEILHTFISHIENIFRDGEGDGISLFSDHMFYFDNSEKSLDIGGHINDALNTDEWGEVLGKTFPSISFFLSGDINTDDCIGIEIRICKNGKCIDAEDFYFNCLDELDMSGDYEDNYDDILEEFRDCIIKLFKAKLKVWRLSDNKNIDLNDAEHELKEARQIYEKTYKKYIE